MTQSRLASLLESKVNVIAGLIVSYFLGLWLYPKFGFNVTPGQNLTIMAIFTLASLIRSYLVRRWFNHMAHSHITLSKRKGG